MSEPAAGHNGNGTTKLLYWILGVMAAIVLALSAFLLDTLASHGQQLRDLQITAATLKAQMAEVHSLAILTRSEQVDRTKAFAHIEAQLLLAEQKELYMDQRIGERLTEFATRLDTQSQRILALATRLDTLRPASGSGTIP